MDGWMNGWTMDGSMKRWMDGWTIDIGMDRRMDGGMENGWMNGWYALNNIKIYVIKIII
jgi:hypothetical protein